jgi:hypothetical protein
MHRRHFFTAASLGIAATGCAQSNTSQDAPTLEGEAGTQSSDGIVIHPWKSDVMSGFPPSPENLVTRENQEDSQEKLRWAMQHYRELFPTQRISRGDQPVFVLPRKHQDIVGLEFQDAKGEKTTVGEQVRALSMDAFIVVHQGKILCEEYLHCFFLINGAMGAQLAAEVPFKNIFEKDRVQELERRHLCNEVAKHLH